MRLQNTMKLASMELLYLFRQMTLVILCGFIIVASYCLTSKEKALENASLFDEFSNNITAKEKELFTGFSYQYSEGSVLLSDEELDKQIRMEGIDRTITNRNALQVGNVLLKQEKWKQERRSIYEKAKAEKESILLSGRTGFELEYFQKIETAYQEEPKYELYSFDGWEEYFFLTSYISKNGSFGVFEVLLIVSASVILFMKDREKKTHVFLAATRFGTCVGAYVAKIMATVAYGFAVQSVLKWFLILWLSLVRNFDMRHILSDIRNVEMFAMADVKMPILGLVLLDMLLKVMVSLVILLFLLLLVRFLRRELFLILSGSGMIAVFYYFAYQKLIASSGISWLFNPMNVLHIGYLLQDTGNKLGNHAVDVRVLFFLIWGNALIVGMCLGHVFWKRGLYEKVS